MKISLIVSDIDGTLLPAGCGQDGKRPDGMGVSDGIARLGAFVREKKLPFTLASGRPIEMMEELSQRLGVELPVVACNGAYGGNRKNVLWNDHLITEEVRSAIELADRLGMAVITTDGSEETVYRENDYTCSHSENGSWSKCYRPEREEEWSQWKVQKLLIIDPESPGKVDMVIEELEKTEAAWKEQGLETGKGITILRYDDRGIEVMPKGCTKGEGVRRLAEFLEIPMHEVLVLGDNKNDIDMFQMAGFGAAVANAVPDLKKEADYISHEEWVYGVIEALETLSIRG